MPRGLMTRAVTGKTTALGAFEIDLEGYESMRKHQLAIVVSATPEAGTLTVDIKTPGSSEFVNIGTIDLVNGPYAVVFEAYAEAIQLTPVLYDAAKTYDVYYTCGNEATNV